MSNLLALCVGISDYPHALPIPPADNEAQQIHLRLRARGADCRLLTGRRATLERFRLELQNLRTRSVTGDTIVLYFSGHGGQDTHAPPELDQSSPEYLLFFNGALRDSDLETELLALNDRNVWLWLDACNAGGMVESQGNLAIRLTNAWDAADQSRGWLQVIASAAQDQLASGTNQGSFLTTALMRVLDARVQPATNADFFSDVRSNIEQTAPQPVYKSTPGVPALTFVLGSQPLAIDDALVQAHVLLGFPEHPFAHLIFFRFADVDAFRAAMRGDDTLWPTSAATYSEGVAARALAFTHAGLNELRASDLARLGEHSMARATSLGNYAAYAGTTTYIPYPGSKLPAFDVGMRARSVVPLRDPFFGEGSFGKWQVRSTPDAPLHGMMIIAGATAAQLAGEVARVRALLPSLIWVAELDGQRMLDRTEHFGFRDGVSKPGVKGIPASGGPSHPRFIPAGATEVFEADDLLLRRATGGASAQALPAWAELGSFLAYRRLMQDVAGFLSAANDLAARLGRTAEETSAMLVGRWRDGTALADANTALGRNSGNDAFDYAEGGCPAFAHARKTNPRNPAITPRPIFRRGVVFGERLATPDAQDDGRERGLHFMCYQSSIEHQFEGVHGWLGSAQQPEPSGGPDALLGRSGSYPWRTPRAYPEMVPGAGAATLTEFIHASGGEYFFAPALSGITALVGP